MNWKEYMRRRYKEEFKPTYDLFISLYDFTLEDLVDEVWLPITNYEGLYEESNYGRTKSFWFGRAKIRKPSLSSQGYLVVTLCKGGTQKQFAVARLVANLFIPNPDNKPEVNHIYSRFSNHVDCIEWATGSENMKHAIDTGLEPSGEDTYNAKLTNEQVLYIRKNPDKLNLVRLADMFGVTSTAISYIQTGKSYRNAGGSVRQAKPKSPRLSDEIRDQIRADYKEGVRGCGSHSLAKKYGVCQATVLQIVKEE